MKITEYQIVAASLVLLMTCVFTGCGKSKGKIGKGVGKTNGQSEVIAPVKVGPVALDSVEEVKDFYKASPEFFVIKKTEDIPEDLKWEDGLGEPVFSSPNAKKGGTMNLHTGDWPRTLRFVGPDASGSFRRHILDNNDKNVIVQPGTSEKNFTCIEEHLSDTIDCSPKKDFSIAGLLHLGMTSCRYSIDMCAASYILA